MNNERRILRIIGLVLFFLFGYIIINVCFFFKWLFLTWKSLSIDEVIYHTKASLKGTNPDVVKDFLTHSMLVATFIWIVIFFSMVIVYKKNNRLGKNVIKCSVFALIFLLALTCYNVENKIGIISYCKQTIADNKSDFIERNYVNPNDVKLTFPDKKRNLIYIYLESMEMTYANKESGGAFDNNYIKELTDIALNNETFSDNDMILNGAACLPGTTWTMAAMFAQTSGVPLKISINGNRMAYQDSFFSGMETLGDILKKERYNQVLLVGSDASFGGRKLYFDEHGNFEIHDYCYAIDNNLLPQDYMAFWGYEDTKLIEFAKKDLLDLASKEEPFNLTMLTVDTHFEDGYVCELCDDRFGDNQYANVIACSSRQIGSFINWVKDQDFYENTTIVICGDHITMDSDFCKGVSSDYLRRTYSTIINGPTRSGNTYRAYSTLDMFPTTLVSLGVKIEGDKLGLGVNLYSEEKTIIEKYGTDYCKEEMSKVSEFLDSYAKANVTKNLMEQIRVIANVVAYKSDNGNLSFSIKKGMIDQLINVNALKNAKLVVCDKEKNTQKSYFMEIIPVETDPNLFECNVETDLPYASLKDITARVYISVGDFEDYFIDDWNGELME